MVSESSVSLYRMAGSVWGTVEWLIFDGLFLAKETHGGRDRGETWSKERGRWSVGLKTVFVVTIENGFGSK